MVAVASAREREREVVKRNDVNFKIDAEIAADAKIVASFRGIAVAEYVSELLRPLVKQDLEHEMAKRLRRAKKDQQS